MNEFCYFRIDTPGVKDSRYVRVRTESIDDEFAQMCKEEGTTFPFQVFNLAEAGPPGDFVHVLCNRLRRVAADKAAIVAGAWATSEDNNSRVCQDASLGASSGSKVALRQSRQRP